MAAGKHVVIWPKVRVTIDGKSKVLDQRDLVPAGVSATDLDNLVSFGAIAGVAGGPDPETEGQDEEFDVEKGGTIPATMAWVGDDKDRAAQVLEVEDAKGDDARPGLVKKLAAVLDA